MGEGRWEAAPAGEKFFKRARAEGRIGPERKLKAYAQYIALRGWLHYARLR